MRIVGGRHKGRRLEGPGDRSLRPTADRTRESLFNLLSGGRLRPHSWLRGARVLDLFAGSGALGIEALSRGAGEVFFIEKSPSAVKLIQRNLAGLDQKGTRVLQRDALDPPKADAPAALILLDPPYGLGLGTLAMESLLRQGWIDEESLIVLEVAAREEITVPEGFTLLESRRYGAAKLLFFCLNAPS